MVAIVSGMGLGLNLGSLASLGSGGQFGSASLGQSGERAYVNVSTGNLVLQETDTALVSVGNSASTVRTYNSLGQFDFDNADGWYGSPSKSVLLQPDGTLVRKDSDGSTNVFSWDASAGAFLGLLGASQAQDQIRTDEGGNYVFIDGTTGRTETYSATGSGLIQSSTDTSGNQLVYTYDGQDLLTRVESNDGEAVNYSYSGRNLVQVSTTLNGGQALHEVNYTYDTSNRLRTVSVTLNQSGDVPAGAESGATYTTTYTYSGASTRVASVTQSDGTRLSFSYVNSGGVYKVASVTDGLGQITRFSYNNTTRTTTVTDALGVASTYRYDASGQLAQVRTGVTAARPNGVTQMTYSYDSRGDVLSVTDGLGQAVTFEYDVRGNQTAQTDALGNRLARTFNARNQLLTETVFPSDAHPLTSRNVYDSADRNLLRFSISAEGRVTEHRYDASGLRTSTIQYAAGTYPTQGLATDEVPTLDQLQDWAAQQDLTQTQRADMAYDFRGQLQTLTTYSEVDASGAGVAGASVRQYVYDQKGELLQTVTPDGGGISQMIYDGLGRVVSSSQRSADASINITTLTQYDDAHGKTTMTMANGLATVSVYDRAGRIVSVTQNAGGPALGTTQYAYDALGNVTMTVDPTGLRHWMLYDEAGRKVADINADGQLNEYVYDSDNRLTETVAYATKVDTATLVDGTGQPLTKWNANPARAPAGVTAVTLSALRQPSDGDQRSWNFYDAADRLAFQVDALGRVTQTQYDGASRVVAVTRLASPVDTAMLADGRGLEMLLGGFVTSTELTETIDGGANPGPNSPRILTATVSSLAPATGVVSFYVGDRLLGTSELVDGIATLVVSNLPPGLDHLSAVYAGDAGNLGSRSNTVLDDVAPALETTTVLVASAPSAAAGASVTLAATVSGQDVTGMVTFYSGTRAIGIAAVINGVATVDVNNLPRGNNVLTAVYQGDAFHALSTSAPITEVVTRSPSTTAETVTTLLASNRATNPGAPVTLTAQVSGAMPGGTVNFYSNGQLIGSATLANGLAALTVSSLPVGTDRLTARYLGDVLNTASTSAAINTVVLAPAAVGVSASAPGAALGEPLTFTAAVSGANPGGVVSFFNGTVLLGSAAVVAGQASLTISSLPVGLSTVTAVYSGDAANATAASTGVAVTIDPATTTTVLATSAASSAYSSNLTLTATVAGTGSAHGLVTFYNGATVLGSASVVNGAASLTVNDLPVGVADLSAVFEGDEGNVASTSAVVSQTITTADVTQTSLDVSPSSAAFGAPVTLTARIDGAGAIGGTVTFYNGATVLGTATVTNGQASLTVSNLPVGAGSLGASYGGDALHSASTSAVASPVIAAAATSLGLASSAASSAYGVPVVLTATLGGGVGPTGSVTFFNGRTAVGTAVLVNGVATLSLDNLPVGTLALSAAYAGDAGNASSVATFSQTIAPAATTATLTSSQALARQGAAVVLTARVTGNANSRPGGTVTFYSGADVLGTATVTNGFAALTVSSLPVGSSVLTASYAGDARNAGSVSAGLVETVSAAPQASVTTLATSAATVTQGASFTLTANVSGASPGGTVTFLNGQVVLGTATVDGSGVAALTTNIRTVGNASIYATYSGDSANATSVSARVAVRVNAGSVSPLPPAPPSTTTTLTASVPSAVRGDPVTLFARVDRSVAGVVPSGTVSFFAGTALIGSATLSSGQASLTLTNLPVGADQIRAVYSGDASCATSTSGIVNESISLASSSVTLTQSATTVVQGAALVLTAQVPGNLAPGGTVSFYSGATLIATVGVVNGLASRTVTTLPVGTTTLTARYNGDANYATATSSSSTVIVTAAPAASTVNLTAAPAPAALGNAVTLTANVAGTNPQGTVSFFNNNTLLGSAMVVNGQAVFNASGLPRGTATLRAVYSGDTGNLSSTSSVVTESVVAAATTTVLTTSAPTSGYGSALTLQAQVSGTGNPAGTVRFYNGTTLLGSATLSGGVATLTVSNLPIGADALSAVYQGNTGNTASTSATVSETITPATPVMTVTSGPSIPQNGVLTVHVAGSSPTGAVTFLSGQTVVGVATLVNGVATLSGVTLSPGTYELSATYGGNARNASGVLTFTQTFSAAESTTVVSTSTPYVAQNAPLVITARVTGSDPTGSVVFFRGDTAIGTSTLVNGLGAITLNTLDDGLAPLRAEYSGDVNNTASSSAVLAETVVKAPVNIGVTSSAASVKQGTSLTLQASVAGDNPAGTVSFVSGNVTLGVATIVNGVATLTVPRVSLPVGANDIVVVYLGDDNNAATISPALVQTVTLGIADVYAGKNVNDRTGTMVLDGDGRLRATVDAEGYITEMRYNAVGRLVETVRYASRVDGFTDAASIAAQVAQARLTGSLAGLAPAERADDIHTYLFYNARGEKVGEVDGEGYLSEYVYDVNGNLSQQIRYANAVTAPLPASSLASIRPASSPLDSVQTSNWDALNRLSAQTNAEGTVTAYTYDEIGRVVRTDIAANTSDLRTLTVRYDVQGHLVGELSPEGAALLTGGQSQSEVDAIWAQHGLTHTYDAAGRRTSTTDANGLRTVFLYDEAGRLRYSVNAQGEVQERRYGALGRLEQTVSFGARLAPADLAALEGGVLSSTPATTQAAQVLAALQDGSESINSFAYDAAGQLIETTDAESGYTRFDYDAFGELVQTLRATDDGYRISTNSYDRRGLNILAVQDPLGVEMITTSEYDAFGRLVNAATGSINTQRHLYQQAYDRLGRVIVTTDPLNSTRSTAYDAFGRVLTQTDALGNATQYSYDREQRSVTMTTAEGITVTTTHDRLGQTHSVTDGNGNTSSYSYDRNGNLTGTQTPLTSSSAEYDNANRLIRTVDANGVAVEYTYDAANRQLTRTVDPSGLALQNSYEYDAKGRQITATDANGVATRTSYDLNGRVITQTVDPTGLNLTTTYSYNRTGEVLTVTSPGGTVTSYVYDGMGRRTEEHLDPQGLDLVCLYAYDSYGNLSRKTDANGVSTTYVYDAANHLVFTIDGAGGVRENSYDAQGRVVKSTAYAHALPAGADLSSEATVRAQLSPSAADVVQDNVFDNDGRLSYVVDGAGGVTRYFRDGNGNVTRQVTYAALIDRSSWTPGTAPTVYGGYGDREIRTRYDSLNRAEWVVDGAGSVRHLTYDGNGNVVERISYATKVDLSAWEVSPYAVTDAAHDQVTRTVFDATNRALYVVDGTGAVLAQRYDGNGNVVDRVAYANRLDEGTPVTALALDAAVALMADPQHDAHVRRVFDAANRLRWSADGAGAVTRQDYDANGNLVKQVAYATAIAAGADLDSAVASSADRVNLMAYDAVNQKTWQIDAQGGVTQFVYDAAGNLVERTAYNVRVVAPDAQSDPAQVESMVGNIEYSSDNRTVRAVYDGANRQVLSVDASGAATATVYNGAGNSVATIAYAQTSSYGEVPSASSQDRLTVRAFDGAGRQIYSVDALGYVSETRYDGSGQIVSKTLYSQSITGGAPPALGLADHAGQIAGLLQQDFWNDRTDSFSYDGGGNLVWSADAMYQTESYGRDGLGNKISFTNKNGATWTYEYDAAGRMISETSPPVVVDAGGMEQPIVTRLAYDALGNLVARTEAAGIEGQERTTHYEYDALGRQVRTLFPPVSVYDRSADNLATNGANGVAARHETPNVVLTTETTYDVFGDAVANRDVAGNFSYKAYDKSGRVTAEIDALGYVTGYERNTFGDTTTLTRYGQALTLPANGASAAQISAALSGIGEVQGRAITTEYDQMGRAVRVTEPEVWVHEGPGSGGYYAARTTLNIYNAFGEVEQTGVRENSEVFIATTNYYDRRGELVGTMDPLGYLTTQQFDAAGNVVRRTEYANSFTGFQGTLPLGIVDGQGATGPAFDVAQGIANSVTNPSGPWQYGWKPYHQGEFNLYDTNVASLPGHEGENIQWGPSWSANAPYPYIPYVLSDEQGTVIVHPGPDGEVTTIRWTAPAAGRYRIDFNNVENRQGGYTTRQVYAAGQFVGEVVGYGNSLQTYVTLQAGEYVDFEVGNGGDGYGGDGTWFDATVTPVDANAGLTNTSVDDRVTTYEYDQLNRKTSETRVNVEHSNYSDGSVVNDHDPLHSGEGYYGGSYYGGSYYGGGGGSPYDLTTYYEYDAVGNLRSTTDALGNRTSSYYDSLGRVVRVRAPYTNIFVSDYGSDQFESPETLFLRDAYGNVVIKVERASGYEEGGDRVTQTEFDSHGHATKVTDAQGYEHFMSYDARGQLVKQWQSVTGNGDEGTHTLFTFFDYDALGHQTDVVTPGSNSVVSGGAVTTINQASAGVVHTRSVYNAYGEMVQRGTYRDNAVQLTEHFDYDEAGRLWRTNSGDGVETVMLYDLLGHQTAQISSAGGSWGADMRLVANAEAADGLSEGVRRSDAVVDALGHALEQHLPQRSDWFTEQTLRPVIYQTFDRWGNVISQSDPRDSGIVTRFRYNANNQVVQQTQPGSGYYGGGFYGGDIYGGPLSAPTTYIRYDAMGQQVAIVDANGHVNGQVWDESGHVIREEHADGGVVNHHYNIFGEQVELEDAMGNKTDYTYDALGRVTKIEGQEVTVASADASFNVTTSTSRLASQFTYDSAGRKLSETNPAGEVTYFSYDLRGNVIASRQPMGEVSRAAFDVQGHQIASQDPNGALSTWTYDAFGQLQGYQDIGGANHWLTYDNARQLTQQGSSRGQNIEYQYDDAGQLVRIDDHAVSRDTQYGYDAAGHRTRERMVQNETLYQDNYLQYDNLGRLSQIQALDDINIRFDYDAVGNKVHQHTEGHALARAVEGTEQVQTGQDESGNPVYTSHTTSTTVYDATSQDHWFAYDAMNRQILVDGVHNSYDISSSNINSAQGHVLTYDLNGNRISDMRYGQQVTLQDQTGFDESGNAVITSSYANRQGAITEYYSYDKMNRLVTVATGGFDVNLNPLDPSQAVVLDRRLYDAAGRLVRNGPAGTLSNAYIDALNAGGKGDANGAITRVNRYDADGRLQAQHVTKPDGTFNYDTIYAGTVTSEVQVESGHDESGNPIYTTQTITQTGPGYDAAGNIRGYRVTDSSGVTSSYNMTMARFEGYKEGTVSGVRSDNPGQVRTTTNIYDENGMLTGITDDTGSDVAHRLFINDADGIVLQKTQQSNVLKQLVVAGQVYASYGMAENPQSPGTYTTQTTFNPNYQPINNGYPSASVGAYTVRAGDTLEEIAQASYGDRQMWYLIADANGLRGNSDLRVGQTLNIPSKVGSVHNNAGTYKPYNPSEIIGDTTPTLPVPQNDDDGCGGFGQIIMIVVAVVVAAIVGPEVLPFFEGAFGAGAAATVAAGATAAAAGSIASQVVGNAIGAVDGFSWKAVALAAIGGGVGAGLNIGGVLPDTGNVIGNAIIKGAVSSALTQGIAVATGLQDKFSWRGVAASAIGAGVSAGVADAVGPSFGDSDFGKFATGFVSKAAGGLASNIVSGGKIRLGAIAADAFGNALGDSLAAAIKNPAQQTGSLQRAQAATTSYQDGDIARSELRFATYRALPTVEGIFGDDLLGAGTTSRDALEDISIDTSTGAPEPIGIAAGGLSFASFDAGGGGFRNGQLYAANGVRDPFQPLVMSDAGGGGGDDMMETALSGGYVGLSSIGKITSDDAKSLLKSMDRWILDSGNKLDERTGTALGLAYGALKGVASGVADAGELAVNATAVAMHKTGQITEEQAAGAYKYFDNLAAGIKALGTDFNGTIGKIGEAYAGKLDRAASLRADGKYFEAAAIQGEIALEALSVVAGGAGLAKAALKLGRAGAEAALAFGSALRDAAKVADNISGAISQIGLKGVAASALAADLPALTRTVIKSSGRLEAEGVAYAYARMSERGYKFVGDMVYGNSGHGLDMVFKDARTGRYAVLEAKSGSDLGQGGIKVGGVTYRQGSAGYIENQLTRYLDAGGTRTDVVAAMRTQLATGTLESYASMRAADRLGQFDLTRFTSNQRLTPSVWLNRNIPR